MGQPDRLQRLRLLQDSFAVAAEFEAGEQRAGERAPPQPGDFLPGRRRRQEMLQPGAPGQQLAELRQRLGRSPGQGQSWSVDPLAFQQLQQLEAGAQRLGDIGRGRRLGCAPREDFPSELRAALLSVGHGIRRLVTVAESVAKPRSKAPPEMFRASTRTVLFVHVSASSSVKRAEEASDASAQSPRRGTGSATSNRCAAPPVIDGRSSGSSTLNSRWPTGSP